ncbi:peptidoglycan -binding protein [Labrys monachus]|uniref:Chemotaxis protein MotB n=1 Tax=Labrys monachus TaxID=217067 RepID=A0ABU0FAZ7_9HYPH|nr:peptidoglycan -binding protein [Labrys monachus]MDQ0391215.1 chemotaxis protein MotB [Labrys monachus]
MPPSRSRRRSEGINYWPGFVDALSTLLLSIIMILSIFVLGQFFLSQEVSGKDEALSRLNAQIAELSQLLSLERANGRNAQEQLAALTDSLSKSNADKVKLQGLLDAAQGDAAAAQASGGAVEQIQGELDSQKRISDQALAQVELLNQQISALRRQIAALEQALDASESKDRESQTKIADLGSRLNAALAQRVQELSRYRSDFFGRLRDVLGNRPDVRVVGDRFVFQSEVFFQPGQAALQPEGKAEMDKLAAALLDLQGKIPSDIPWVLRVDGHTDDRPINSPQFPSNWELSASRAISVVQYLISKGIPAQRLVAAGFGEFQPIDTSGTEEARKKNRRIELKLTER